MYAIIEDSGTQFRVEQGQTLDVDCRAGEPGATVTFDRVCSWPTRRVCGWAGRWSRARR